MDDLLDVTKPEDAQGDDPNSGGAKAQGESELRRGVTTLMDK